MQAEFTGSKHFLLLENGTNKTLGNVYLSEREDIRKVPTEMFKQAYFKASTRFSGSTYLLSREALFFYPSFGQAMCGLAGGYLVEINSRDELDFIKNFLFTHGYKFNTVMAGGTDQGHEGVWYNRYSQSIVNNLWFSKQPDNAGGRQHCQSFYRSFNWELDDIECVFNNKWDVGFMCELNE
ncbi:C-type lectin domain family 10 member A [Biomphalaria pfeifferi]|uniref:C-type lectin domain family 10 member A n=1 Tax=Biomphalaria pfeifferi TaxID=112525 RepID=A0AAD8AYD7_BIOPF|nr:C-type lectin domain family 10 member A [Biomphalaria pfeifferi]